MDEQLSAEAIKSNIEFFKTQKEFYSSLYSQALLNEVKYSKMLQELTEEE